jgi:hypothetical protein
MIGLGSPRLDGFVEQAEVLRDKVLAVGSGGVAGYPFGDSRGTPVPR